MSESKLCTFVHIERRHAIIIKLANWWTMVFLNECAPTNTTSYHTKQKLAKLKGEMEKNHNYNWEF